jgi:hypothetical protein
MPKVLTFPNKDPFGILVNTFGNPPSRPVAIFVLAAAMSTLP